MVDDSEINGLVSLTSYEQQNTLYAPTIFLFGNATINNNGTALQHIAEGEE